MRITDPDHHGTLLGLLDPDTDDLPTGMRDRVGHGLDGPFVLMGFPDPNPEVVWMENGPNSVYFEGADEVDHYTEVFDHLRARALGPPETHAHLTGLLKEKRT
ncbi:Scr1 family TA system antitoxin-like transcriptional regulator [Kitasatospora purpeofusca]|uniref:Scr1 family TA system antitoxin-like transcriptional regulator n=1 Tax=Kitasatospora purpeofusca TaxID=67352 RepID=UPI003646A60D